MKHKKIVLEAKAILEKFSTASAKLEHLEKLFNRVEKPKSKILKPGTKVEYTNPLGITRRGTVVHHVPANFKSDPNLVASYLDRVPYSLIMGFSQAVPYDRYFIKVSYNRRDGIIFIKSERVSKLKK